MLSTNNNVFTSRRNKSNKLESKFNLFTFITFIVLVAYVFLLMGLLLWAFMTSFKTIGDYRLNKIGLPKQWVWNYETVFNQFYVFKTTDTGREKVSMGTMFLNAFFYSLGCAFTNTLVPCFTAYLCSRFKYKFSKIVHSIVIITMIIPIVGSLPSEIQMAKNLMLYDKLWGLWIMKANFLGMYFLLFYNNFKVLPMAYTEAAKIDGAGNTTIFLRIIFPLIRNTFITIMLIKFIEFWNDYQIPLVYMPSYPTIALGMYHMAYTTINNLSRVPMRMAGSIMMITPILILFLAVQKRLLGNLTMGGIKG